MPKVYEKIPFTDEEIAHFNECGKFHEFANGEIWAKIKEYLATLESEALNDVQKCLSSNEVKGQLATRWQQRTSVAAALRGFVELKSENYTTMREQLKKQEEEEWQQQ